MVHTIFLWMAAILKVSVKPNQSQVPSPLAQGAPRGRVGTRGGGPLVQPSCTSHGPRSYQVGSPGAWYYARDLIKFVW